MAGNSVAANLLMLFFIVGGLLSAYNIKQEVFPELSMGTVSISVAYPGSTPEDVESGIILALEEAIRNVDGIKEISATAAEGSARLNCELLLGADEQKVYQDIKSEIDRVTTLPEDAERPVVALRAMRREVIELMIYGDVSERVLREVAEQLRDGLLGREDITQVDLSGVRAPEIGIEVPQATLRSYGLTLDDVASRIRNYAVELPGGAVKTTSGEILIRMDERRNYAREYENIPIITDNHGSRVTLGDIAMVRDGFEDKDLYALYNGKPAATLEVYRVGDETPIGVADAVQEFIEDNSDALPPGVSMATMNDRSVVYRQRAELMLRNGAYGLVLVLVLLGFFLEPRLAFWVMMGIPISFLGTFIIMPSLGISINVMSMFAFIIALGIVVDDAIVVGENIYEYTQRGMSFREAAVRGAKDVTLPVSFSILTNVAAFLPLMFIPGVMGKVFMTIPVVVISAFLISWVECMLILPAHLGHQRDRRPDERRGWFLTAQEKFSHGFRWTVEHYYGPFLDRVLRWRYVFLASGLALLIGVIGYVMSGRMGFELFPTVESDYAYVTFTLPYGSPVEKTEAAGWQLLNAAQRVIDANGGDQLAVGTLLNIGSGDGGSGSHVGRIYIYLTDPELRPIQTLEFVNQWREETGELLGVEYVNFMSDRGGPGSGQALSVELSHRNLATLQAASSELAALLAEYPLVKDTDDGFQQGKRQMEFKVTETGAALGLTSNSLGRQVRATFYGAQALRQQRGRDEIKVMVRMPRAERESEYFLENMVVRSPVGIEVPLFEAATPTWGHSYTTITRRNQRRTVTVTGDVTPRSKAGEVVANLKAEILPEMVRKYPGLTYSFEGRQAQMAESMEALYGGLSLALLAIYGLLAIPFKSYWQPLIIMVSIPFGIIGAVFGHILMGYSLSVMSMLGIVALAGVVVNDSLILIDYANRQRLEGKNAHDAVCSAGVRRFRPIMLTTFTTFGGLAPMIFETSRQARFMIPMALSLGYGLLFATTICLLLIPCLYMMLNDIGGLFRKKVGEEMLEA